MGCLNFLTSWQRGDGAVAQDFRCGCRVGAAGPLQRSVLERDCIMVEILLLNYITFPSEFYLIT